MADIVGAYQLNDLSRCPHCAIAGPTLIKVGASEDVTNRRDGGRPNYWAAYQCASCGSIITAQSYPTTPGSNSRPVWRMFPSPRDAHEDLPEAARKFLQQAYETLHAPDAAAVMAGSCVDAMLKDKGYKDGSLYVRIDKALADNVLTQSMADWAHSVRLGSNRPRHADADQPHVSATEAQQSVDFAEALGQFLYVLTARIQRGIEAAGAVGE